MYPKNKPEKKKQVEKLLEHGRTRERLRDPKRGIRNGAFLGTKKILSYSS